jgi:hypothetical protein
VCSLTALQEFRAHFPLADVDTMAAQIAEQSRDHCIVTVSHFIADRLKRVFLGGLSSQSHFSGSPQMDHPIAPRLHVERDFLTMHKLGFERLRSLFEYGHFEAPELEVLRSATAQQRGLGTPGWP